MSSNHPFTSRDFWKLGHVDKTTLRYILYPVVLLKEIPKYLYQKNILQPHDISIIQMNSVFDLKVLMKNNLDIRKLLTWYENRRTNIFDPIFFSGTIGSIIW